MHEDHPNNDLVNFKSSGLLNDFHSVHPVVESRNVKDWQSLREFLSHYSNEKTPTPLSQQVRHVVLQNLANNQIGLSPQGQNEQLSNLGSIVFNHTSDTLLSSRFNNQQMFSSRM